MIKTLLLSSSFFVHWTTDARLNAPRRSLQPQLSAEAQFAVQSIRTKKILELVTDEDISGSILDECQGDCDDDNDCLGDLVCLERDANDPVPGCGLAAELISNTDAAEFTSFTSVSISVSRKENTPIKTLRNSRDFCIRPIAQRISDEESSSVDLDSEDNGGRYGLCQGPCIRDNDCGEGLICYTRGRLDPAPGCSIISDRNDQPGLLGNICVREIFKNTEYYLNTPTDAPTMAPTTIQFPLLNVGSNREPANLYPLAICQADCDVDNDCLPGLFCLQRRVADDPVSEYCSGTPRAGLDYCIPEAGASMTNILMVMDMASTMDLTSSVSATAPITAPAPTPPTPAVNRPAYLDIQLKIVGDDGVPERLYPLRVCEADCDSDADCQAGLVCLRRSEDDNSVPEYCSGSPVGSEDYCVVAEGVSLTTVLSTQTTPRQFPVQIVGDDGEPESAYPLKICQGDCDDDSDCESEFLVCQQREEGDFLSGFCSGSAVRGEDYCVPEEGVNLDDIIGNLTLPEATAPPTLGPTMARRFPLNFIDGDPDDDELPLRLCEGDCDDDDECGPFLVCGQRDDGDPVSPYCYGDPEDSEDYCIPAEGATLEQILLANTIAPTRNPTNPPTPLPTNSPTPPPTVERQFPLSFISDSEDIEFPLQICQGDCDDDEDCDVGLICEQRDSDDDVSIYCTGEPIGSEDYCVPAEGVSSAQVGSTAAAVSNVPPPSATAPPIAAATPAPVPVPAATPAPVAAPTANDAPPGEIGEYDDFDWDELPDNIRAAAVTLGHDEDSWNNGEEIATDDLMWESLSDAQKAAAAMFGYDEESWNNSDNWEYLSDAQREAAEFLGYDQNSWDNSIAVAVDDLCWVELSNEQQEAGETLGYNQEKWDQGQCGPRR